jgi:hypothetical protein
LPLLREKGGVVSRAEVLGLGLSPHVVAAQIAARRWQRFGPAVLLHNAATTPSEQRRICLLNCGPRAVLTSFTAAHEWGLRGWERPEVQVLAPAGTTTPRLPGLRLHRIGDWSRADLAPARADDAATWSGVEWSGGGGTAGSSPSRSMGRIT